MFASKATATRTAAQSVTVNIKDISVAPASATVDHNDLCPSTGNIVLSYTGGTLGTNATAEWYTDAAFTTNVGSGNNLTLATPVPPQRTMSALKATAIPPPHRA